MVCGSGKRKREKTKGGKPETSGYRGTIFHVHFYLTMGRCFCRRLRHKIITAPHTSSPNIICPISTAIYCAITCQLSPNTKPSVKKTEAHTIAPATAGMKNCQNGIPKTAAATDT